MAEDIHREYKEDQNTVSELPGRLFRNIDVAKLRRGRGTLRPRPSEPAVDYRTFKATLASAVEEIKLVIHDQHQQTREEVHIVRHDVLAAIKASPAEYVKLACEFAILLLLFSLAVRFILKIELVNTAFALFMLPALAIYWVMARLKQQSDTRDDKNPQ